MRRLSVYVLSTSVAALVLGSAPAATATSGYFVSGGASKVTRHRTLIADAGQKTTIVDQIEFGSVPDVFAWVLPVKGMATLDLSSDALFNNLDEVTKTVVEPPPLGCPPPECGTGGMGGAGGGGGGMPTVVVPARTSALPYETVFIQPGG
ncbi:MAG TPA: DUF2330 domain-containing protein, partial [Polyangium sp.]|nr:DUF2330 domain-containing protein [Polyangium sp.]